MILADTIADIPNEVESLAAALITQRELTLAIYADLPEPYWQPTQFPFSPVTNPPLWELSHIGYFAEYFCLRWSADDPLYKQIPSILSQADALFNSNMVAHKARWQNQYPSKSACFSYIADVHARALAALRRKSQDDDLHLFQLALAHEDMHQEALMMTLQILQLPLVDIPQKIAKVKYPRVSSGIFKFDGGDILLGESNRAYRFCNEKPAMPVTVAAFEIDARPVTAREFQAWRRVASDEMDDDCAMMHITHDEATAYAAAQGRRLPTEAEWEFAARNSPEFWASTGQVWEWTSSVFAPYPGFTPGPYAEYSAPWFADNGVPHMVLKGGAFVSHPRMKYPQYRNFFTPDRRDMFCGFRTARSL